MERGNIHWIDFDIPRLLASQILFLCDHFVQCRYNLVEARIFMKTAGDENLEDHLETIIEK